MTDHVQIILSLERLLVRIPEFEQWKAHPRFKGHEGEIDAVVLKARELATQLDYVHKRIAL
jgi:hypothetical protein